MFTINALLILFVMFCSIVLILWGIGQIPGIPGVGKNVIYVIVGVLMLLWVLQSLGGGVLE